MAGASYERKLSVNGAKATTASTAKQERLYNDASLRWTKVSEGRGAEGACVVAVEVAVVYISAERVGKEACASGIAAQKHRQIRRQQVAQDRCKSQSGVSVPDECQRYEAAAEA